MALAAKAATTTIPIVFTVGDDPVRLGLVASLARPGGNLTGIKFFDIRAWRRSGWSSCGAGRPRRARSAVLVEPSPSHDHRDQLERRGSGCARHGLAGPGPQGEHQPRDRRGIRDLRARAADALFVSSGPLFNSRRLQLVLLAARYGIPATYLGPRYTSSRRADELRSKPAEPYRQVGIYAGRILKGEKPADLPVVQATKFELVINLKTAKVLGLEIPPTLLARADEVIE